MRRLTALVLFALVAAACGKDTTPPPSPTPAVSPTGTASPTLPPTPSPPPSPAAIEVPEDAPTTFAKRVAPDEVPAGELVPPGAQVTSVWRVPPSADAIPQIVLAWTRGSDPFAAEHGLAVWQQFPDDPPWRVVYALSDPPAAGVLAVRFDTGDLTGDGYVDALTFEDMGGSGGCGVWRVIRALPGSASEIYRRHTCDTRIEISRGSLIVTEAVYAPGDSHCCPSAMRTTNLRWNGTTWDVIDEVVTPT